MVCSVNCLPLFTLQSPLSQDDPHGENDDKEAEPAEHEEHHEEHEAEHELHEEHREARKASATVASWKRFPGLKDREIPEQTAEVRFPAPSEPPEARLLSAKRS